MKKIDHLNDDDLFMLLLLSIAIGYIFSLKRVNDTKFASIHRVYKYLIALLCSFPFFSLPFAFILVLFRSQYEKPLTAFEEKYSESGVLKRIINTNKTIGLISIFMWMFTLPGTIMMCGSGSCSSSAEIGQVSLLSYPLVAIFTLIMTKMIKFRTKIPAAVISFLYYWFIFFVAFLFIYVIDLQS